MKPLVALTPTAGETYTFVVSAVMALHEPGDVDRSSPTGILISPIVEA